MKSVSRAFLLYWGIIDYRIGIGKTMKNSGSKNLVIIGGGGHARMLIECMEAGGLTLPRLILDKNKKLWGEKLYGVPIAGGDELLPELINQGITHFAVGLGSTGDNRHRQRIFDTAISYKLKPFTIVHPSSIVSKRVKIGSGSQLLPGCIVNAGVELGNNVIVNSGAVVEHDCIIGDHAHIATGAKLAGAVIVKSGAHIGVGAAVMQSITIGKNAIVGAGAVVINGVPPDVTVAGCPAAPLEEQHLKDMKGI